ncbi:MAG: hypothetical protein CVT64_11155 [Actinobacteria bacterium HGW-Actinobacteria-4]|nr:MAG: hypothetical protein CVT64_11155 [Actinobacteria bacterium HGW-Actinobacteria-4]
MTTILPATPKATGAYPAKAVSRSRLPKEPVVSLPLGTASSLFFLDESGSKGTGGHFFVVGGIKTRQPGHLLREAKAVRDKHRFYRELKFAELTKGTLPIYRDLIDVLSDSDVHLVAFVIDKRLRDPFVDVPQWDAQSRVVTQLLHGNINRAEVATLLMDSCSTPTGVSIEETILERVNQKLESMNLVSAVTLDSQSSDGLQLADLVVGAISCDRRLRSTNVAGHATRELSPKATVARMLAASFGVPSLADTRTSRVNILTSRARSTRK